MADLVAENCRHQCKNERISSFLGETVPPECSLWLLVVVRIRVLYYMDDRFPLWIIYLFLTERTFEEKRTTNFYLMPENFLIILLLYRTLCLFSITDPGIRKIIDPVD